MSFLQGGFIDLTGYGIGDFTVDGLVGRDNRRIPRWEVSCKYGHSQFLGHLRLAALVESRRTQTSLQCTNAGCPLYKSSSSGSETLAEFLKRERQAEQTAAQAEAERQKAADAQAAKERAKEQRLEKLRREYIEFWLDQIKIEGHPESEIPSLRRWLELSDGTRQMILERIHQTPGKCWTF